ncbi:hypothetical protein JCM8097_003646 [Rhodosporidiobolus ruineniae]
MSTVTDSWLPSGSSCAALPSPASTPTKRASRSSRISNDTDHRSFRRTTLDDDTGLDTTVDFTIGDIVVVGEQAKLKQKFLHPPPYLVPLKQGKGKGKRKQVQQDTYEGWTHEDGLKPGDKVAVITRLFEDVRGRKCATVRWFARPGAVWGPDDPPEEEEAAQVLPYELYYTSDSTHLHDSRVMRSRAAANPFLDSPSSSPSKSGSSRSSSSRSSSSMSTSHHLSAAAAFRTPQHSDPIPLSSITSHAEVLSPSALSSAGTDALSAANQRPLPTFLCRWVYDVNPVRGAGFWGAFDWDELRTAAVETYAEKMEEGPAAHGEAQDGWDVEAVMEDEEEEVKPKKKVAKGKKQAIKERKVDAMNIERDEESSDDEAGEEDTFDPRSQASDASDDDGSSGDEEQDSDSEEDEESYSSDEGSFPRTPAKRSRRTSQLPTPSSFRRTKRPAAPSSTAGTKRPRASTTSAGRAAKRQRFAARKSTAALDAHNPLPPLLSSAHLETLTPFERAKALLHVSATPESLPCREEQRERIRSFLGDAILGRSGGCLYVHGVPGTGKTATVHSVVRELQNDPDMDAFTFVEINGMKISEPMAAFSHLWSALAPSTPASSTSPRKPSPRAALSLLEQHFSTPDPARRTTVVLVDELDQMLTKRQDVLYSFFNWPHVPHSRLVVVAVANTMDLPERELSGKIRSRLGTNRIPFAPYTWTELKQILEARLSLVDPASSSSATTNGKKTVPLFDDVALQKIAKSVAGISGDARKALDVARRTLDRVAMRLAKEEVDSPATPSTPSKGKKGKKAPAPADGKEIRCTIQDATQAYNDMTRQGPAVFVRRASLMMKVLLLAVARCIRRAGVQEVEVDTVLTWHLDFLRQTSLLPSPSMLPTKAELLALLAQLHALRLVATENQRLDVFQRVRATVDEGDLFAALREDEMLVRHVKVA